ncbi:hypothetical protein FA15DRAFT_674294 [Coprinopsis marcescibilis]|uniref:Uncharacterized protein n=1 Tax=Coprinopsis marcescibilis TaxID=230819 RepID=A0A5C3KI89_COPMA|nr:hypothetical protein FA15DRAFT_674294 [Coprinopsis marcescibilis]
MWRMEVERCRRSQPETVPLIDLTDFIATESGSSDPIHHDYYRHAQYDDESEMERMTYIAEGDKRVFNLPHPDRNPLMCYDVDLIEEEYKRVLHEWNDFEEEKWEAQKKFRNWPTPDNLQRLISKDIAVQTASSASRYLEYYAGNHRLPIDFHQLFFKIYRPPEFYLYMTDDDWSPISSDGSFSPFDGSWIPPTSTMASTTFSPGLWIPPRHMQSQLIAV